MDQADGEVRAAASVEVPEDVVIEAAREVAEDSRAGALQALTAGALQALTAGAHIRAYSCRRVNTGHQIVNSIFYNFFLFPQKKEKVIKTHKKIQN